jgi:adenylate cyclase
MGGGMLGPSLRAAFRRSDMADEHDDTSAARGRLARLARALRGFDGKPGVVGAAQALRRRLPGDGDYGGDPLSLSGDEAPHRLAQALADVADERPSALREVGFGALQVWQSVSEAQGRGRGGRELAILFIDLVEFSSWALQAGDDAAVQLLREVSRAVDPVVKERGGRIVKRLGDGLMAVFDDASEAVAAALEARDALGRVEVAGHRPQLRAGVHFGRPRRMGGDYLGVDVNVAARVADAAGADEVLVSEAVCARLEEGVALRRRWLFRGKGTPKGLKVFAAELDGGG